MISVVATVGDRDTSVRAIEPLASALLVSVNPVTRKEGRLESLSRLVCRAYVVLLRSDGGRDGAGGKEVLPCVNVEDTGSEVMREEDKGGDPEVVSSTEGGLDLEMLLGSTLPRTEASDGGWV